MIDRDSSLAFYATQSPFSDPGAMASLLDEIPNDIRAIRKAAKTLVFHYRGDGDWDENGIGAERIAEIDLRYAERMFGRLQELSGGPLGSPRQPNQRMVGCCRDFTLLFVSMLRHKGIPARSRVGFAGYFFADWNVDHVVAEVWDADEQRWRLIDPEIGERHTDPTDNVALDAMDLPRDRFIAGPQAWLACRTGEDDPERYLVSPWLEIPDTRSWPYLLHNLIHDLASLNKREMLLWEDWGYTEAWNKLSDDDLAEMDRTAEAMTAPDATSEALRTLYDREGFRVPEVVTSYTSAVEKPPIQVRIEGITVA